MVNSIILTAATRLLCALLLLFSIYMLWHGHNLPGGGFIGGLIGSTGFILYAIAKGAQATRTALVFEPQNIAMVGLGTALAAGGYAAFLAMRSSPANGGSSVTKKAGTTSRSLRSWSLILGYIWWSSGQSLPSS